MKISLKILAIIFITATLLPLIRKEDWWIRIFDFPRLQIAIGGIVITSAFFFFYNTKSLFENILVGALILCITYQCTKMYPFTLLADPQSLKSERGNPARNISVLVSNVKMDNRNSERFLQVVKEEDPDILCILEPDIWWEKEIEVLDKEYPYSIKHPLNNTYGMIFYSRLKTVSSDLNFVIKDYVPSVHAVVELETGDPVEIYCLHPEPPNPLYEKETTERDAELLIIGKEAKDAPNPVIVAGDLNDVAWSYTTTLFQEISGMLDPRIGRGFYNTFHAQIPVLRFPLDHVFHSDSLRLVEFRRLDKVGSDHFPVLVELSYEPENEEEQEEKKPKAEKQDKKEADEKIEEAK